MKRILVARFASALVAAAVLSGAAFAALVNASALDAKAVVTPVPVFGMSPRAFLPLVLVPSSKFTTLPPGSALPSDAQCAARVKRKPENKRVNVTYNATPGNQQLGSDIFGGDDPRAYTEIGSRVTGHFSGTTDEILQWAACKWGIDEDIVRAQAAIESWWHQDA